MDKTAGENALKNMDPNVVKNTATAKLGNKGLAVTVSSTEQDQQVVSEDNVVPTASPTTAPGTPGPTQVGGGTPSPTNANDTSSDDSVPTASFAVLTHKQTLLSFAVLAA